MEQVVENLVLPKNRKRSGAALILTILVVLISLAIGTGLLAMGTGARVAAIGQVQDLMARSAADAGMERAIQEINNAVAAGKWSDSVLPNIEKAQLINSDSYYSIAANYNLVDGYHIQSTGTNKNRTRTVTATLRLKGLFESAILCREGITLKSGTVVQSIDSDISLDPDDINEKVTIGTNSIGAGSVILNSGVVVDGDVVVGIGGDVDTVIKDLGATTGDRYTLSGNVEFPSISPPFIPWPRTMITVKKGEGTIGSGGDYPPVGRFSGIKLSQGAVLRVVGNCTIYVTGDVDMGQSSEIILDSKDTTLTIYLDGNWISDNNSGINNATQIPSSFMLFATGLQGQILDLKAKSEFYGSIYAPDADLTIFSGGDLYGSFVAKNFELKNSATFYYDTALQAVKVTDEGARYVISRWNEQ